MIEMLRARHIPDVGSFAAGEQVSEARVGKGVAAQLVKQGWAKEVTPKKATAKTTDTKEGDTE